MSPELDAPAQAASLLILGVLVSSAILWYKGRGQSANGSSRLNLSNWPIGWINFGIFICALIIALFMAQNLMAIFFADVFKESGEVITADLALLAVAMTQGPLLLTYLFLRKAYPRHYAGELDDRKATLTSEFKTTFISFLKYLPIIWGSGILWGQLMLLLQNIGLVEELPKQEIVSIFQNGGSILGVALLALSTVLIAPFVEEIIFRGCVYRFFKSQMFTTGAQVASGVVFALIHGNLLSLGPLVVVGVVLARVYESSGNIRSPMLFHAFFNGLNLLLLLLFSSSNIQI